MSLNIADQVQSKRHGHALEKGLRLAALGLACLLLATVSAARTADPPSKLDRVVLQLKWKHQFQFAGYYAALEQGFYRELGLDVVILEAPENIEPARVVLQGKADFGIAASDLVLLRAGGEPVVVLAAIYQHSPLILLSLKGKGLDSIHDLAGKRAMIEPHAAELLAYLEMEGIPISGMTLVPHSFGPDALISGEVAVISAYSTDEPFLLKQAGADHQIFNPRAGGIDLYGDTLFTTEAQIRDHPRRVRAFLDASLRGWQYALEHSDEMVDLIYTKYSRRHSREHLEFEAAQTKRLILPDVVEIGYMNHGRWRYIAEVYAEMGMGRPDLPMQGFLYNRNPSPDLTWFYLSLLGGGSLLGLISIIAVRFYRLSKALRREIAERTRTETDLRALEKHYRVLVETAPFPIVITRLAEGTVLYVNPQTAAKLEIAQNHAVGKSPVEFYPDPADLKKLTARLERQGYLSNHEVQLTTINGRRFWASLSANITTYEEQPAVFYAILDITERRELTSRLETMAMTDDLTGLSNRRYFTRRGREEFTRCRRYQTPLSLLLLDGDKFKDINDTYGHEAGDEVLRQTAKLFRKNLREVDITGRLGGDEFGILLPNTALKDALVLAEKLCQLISKQSIELRGRHIGYTMSIGAAETTPEMGTIDDLFRSADTALYRDKNRNRNSGAGDTEKGR